jgi:hypothetical protein
VLVTNFGSKKRMAAAVMMSSAGSFAIPLWSVLSGLIDSLNEELSHK